MDADRHSMLATRLRLLVQRRWPEVPDRREGRFPDGASAVHVDSGRCWVLTEGASQHRLGAALAVALRAGCPELHLLVDNDEAAMVLARRSQLFALAPQVWVVDGAELRRAVPAPPATDPAPAPEAELYRPVLTAAGLDPVVEGGHLVGELLGLEVGRVVLDDDGSAHVEAGVGRFDREVSAMMFADLGETDALARAVDMVSRVRMPGAERHPINNLVAERWLRSVLVSEPSMIGAAALRSVGSSLPRRDLRSDGVATAVGVDLDGEEVVVVCSTGVYLDLVPSAADDRLAHAPDARLVIAIAERDRVSVTAELNDLLDRPATIIAVPDDWRSAEVGER